MQAAIEMKKFDLGNVKHQLALVENLKFLSFWTRCFGQNLTKICCFEQISVRFCPKQRVQNDRNFRFSISVVGTLLLLTSNAMS